MVALVSGSSVSDDMALTGPGGDRWVFGYGSLMWRPGFDYVEASAALLHGRRRAFCIYSVHHRGTYDRPGLVLGLAPGGAVRGRAYRINADHWPSVYAYLCEREQPTETYIEAKAKIRLPDGQAVEALVFLSDLKHPQWAGRLSLEAQARLIAGATGLSGRNSDYLTDLVEHLRAEGIVDVHLEALLVRVTALEARA
jgi:cation transport protein ChaC